MLLPAGDEESILTSAVVKMDKEEGTSLFGLADPVGPCR